jgi:large subunit ribosomal protein L35
LRQRLAAPDEEQFSSFGTQRAVPKVTEGFRAMPRNASKPKRKLKTHRGAAKRFKITATGKILRMHSGKRHLLGTKKPGRMRKLKKLTLVSPADVAAVKQMLPYA